MFVKRESQTEVLKLIFTFILVMCFLGHLINGLDEGGDIIEPEESGEWEEEEPETAADYKPQAGMKTVTFNPVDLTEEDQHSQHMPQDLLCDGCRVVAYVMTRRLNKTQSRYKKGHRMMESDVIDILDEVCGDENKYFDSYGIKDVDGVRRLSGEGLETKDTPGIMNGGGRWPHRLCQLCQEYVGEFEEDTIYNSFLKSGDSLENLFCRSEVTGNVCVPKNKQTKNTSKKTKEEL